MNYGKLFKNLANAFTNVLIILSIALLVFSMYTAYQFQEKPNDAYLFGYKPILVLTNSMQPTLTPNGIVIVKQATYDDIQKDDILMYEIGDKLITHRVVDKTEDGIITKGDNNELQDAYVITEDNVRAKVVAVWNWAAKPIGEIFPEGTSHGVNLRGLLKWIAYPLFVLLVLDILFSVLVKINKNAKKKATTNTSLDVDYGFDYEDNEEEDLDDEDDEF